jgi:hypothetical protein
MMALLAAAIARCAWSEKRRDATSLLMKKLIESGKYTGKRS